MHVNLTVEGLDSVLRMYNKAIDKMDDSKKWILDTLADDVITEARTNLIENDSINTRDLIDSIRVLEDGEDFVSVGSDLDYAWFVEYGRGAVVPKNKKFLHYFTKDGKEIFSKYSAPAEARPFLEPAIKTALKGLKEQFKEMMMDDD